MLPLQHAPRLWALPAFKETGRLRFHPEQLTQDQPRCRTYGFLADDLPSETLGRRGQLMMRRSAAK